MQKQPKKAPKRPVKKRRARRSGFLSNLVTVLTLIVVFPIGLVRVWSARCNWKRSVKYAVSSCVLCFVAAAIFVLPSLKAPVRTGIELVGSERSAEVYGPEAPENIVEIHVPKTESASVLDTSGSEDTTLYVYAADGAACYHLGTCRYAYASSKRLTVYQAHFLGHKPCNICNPPAYTGLIQQDNATPAPTEEPVEG